MNKKLEVIQEECSDCGICCLASIIRFFGGDVSLECLRYYTGTNNYGTNAYELINCARRFGLDGYGKKLEKLKDIKFPIIAHLKLENDFYHFVVVYKMKNNFVYIMDPSVGLKRIEISYFYKIFTGNVLYFKQVRELPQYNKSTFVKDVLLNEIKTNKKYYIFLLLISILILILTMINNLEIELLNINFNYFFILLFVIIFNEFLNLLRNIIVLSKSISFNNNIINHFVSHIFKLPLSYLKLKQKGEISTRFNELNDLSNNLINFSLEKFFCLILCVFTIFMLIFFSLNLIFTILFFTFIYIIFNIKVYNRLVREIRYSINLEENYNSKILDYISNFDTIKHLNIYDYFINNIKLNLYQKNNITRSLNKKIFIFSSINNILFNIFLLFVFAYLLSNNYNLSKSLVIISLINFYISNLKTIIDFYPTFILFKAYMNKNNEFLSFAIVNKIKEASTFSKIKIKNLSYKINDYEIINNINYEIYNKDKIFINGPSGIGKSTFMKILNNEIQRYSGNILLDGKDIRNLDLSNIVTYVSQNETLFDDTLYNNLCLGQDINNETLNKVINICRLDKLNLEMNSNIVNNSILSGGEKNRVILARSLLHSKNIIILDEVLKEVDKELEIDIIKDILINYADKTIIYISHSNVGYLFENVFTFRKEKD